MTLDCNAVNEYLIETDSIDEQICKAFQIMQNKQPDITLFPEMSYVDKFEEMYRKFSMHDKIMVAGSYCNKGINTTIIYQNGGKV